MRTKIADAQLWVPVRRRQMMEVVQVKEMQVLMCNEKFQKYIQWAPKV